MSEEEAKARFYAAAGAVWFEGHTNYVFIYDTETGLCVMNTGNPGLVGKDVRGLKDSAGLPFAQMMLDMAKRGEGTIRYTFPKGGAKTPLEKVAYVRGFGPWHLMIASAEYMTDLDVTFWNMAQTRCRLIGALLLLSIGIAWLVARSVVKPLSRLKLRMDALSKGELNLPVADAGRSDEVGEMARTVEVFKEAMVETNRLRAEQVEAEQRQMRERKEDMHRMADSFEGAVGQIIATVSSASSATRKLCRRADLDRDAVGKSGDQGRGRFGRSLQQRSIGCLRNGRIVVLGPRDQPPGPGIGAHGQRGRRRRRVRPTTASANSPRLRGASATWSN